MSVLSEQMAVIREIEEYAKAFVVAGSTPPKELHLSFSAYDRLRRLQEVKKGGAGHGRGD